MAKVGTMAMGLGEDTHCWPGVAVGVVESWRDLLLLCRSPEEEDSEGMDPEREAEEGDVHWEVGADEDRMPKVGIDPGEHSIQHRREGEVVPRMGGKRQEEEEGNVGVLRPDTMHAAEVLRRLDMGLVEAKTDAAGARRIGTGDKEQDDDTMDEVDGSKVAGGPRKELGVG